MNGQVPVMEFNGRLFQYHKNPEAPCPLCGGVEYWIHSATGGAVCYTSGCDWSRNLNRTAPMPEPTLRVCAN